MTSTVLAALTAAVLVVCLILIRPFLGVLLWALALSVVGAPLFRRIRARLRYDSLAALLSVIILAFVLIAPLLYLGSEIFIQARAAIGWGQQFVQEERWRTALDSFPRLAPAIAWINENFNLGESVAQGLQFLGGYLPQIFSRSLWSLIALILVLFTTFFFLRDGSLLLKATRTYLPLSRKEEDLLFTSLTDTVHATVYGLFLVAGIQGTIGGIMFALFGIPNAILWGSFMAVLALIPNLGTFLIWAPVGVFMLSQGDMFRGIGILVTGALIVGTIDNFLYPVLVSNRISFHPLAVLFFLLGGVTLFGIVGLVAGPLLLSVAHSTHVIWRDRYDNG